MVRGNSWTTYLLGRVASLLIALKDIYLVVSYIYCDGSYIDVH